MKKNPFTIIQPSIIEQSELESKGLEKDKYRFVECTSLGMQVVNATMVKNNITGKQDPMLAVVVQVAIPVNPDSIVSGLVTPDGVSTKFQQACPIAPVVKLAVHEDFIVQSLKETSIPQLDLTSLLKEL